MVRFGVIGAGNIAKKFGEAMQGVDAKAYAVASRKLEKAERYQKDYGFEKAYEGYDALFEDPLVDALYIATPHAFHYEQMMAALDHGKHVLCEKPFTLNASQAQRVFEKAKAKNLFVMEAMWTRFLPTVQEVMTLVRDGTIGAIRRVDANFTFDVPTDEESRLFNIHLGGGALMDIGIYPITLVNMVLGPPKTFETSVQKHENGIDLAHTITYRYDEAHAHMRASFKDDTLPKAVIEGTKGHIEMPYFWQAEEAYLYDESGALLKTMAHPFRVNGFEYEIEAVINSIEGGHLESSVVPHSLTLEILRQMDRIRGAWGLSYPQET